MVSVEWVYYKLFKIVFVLFKSSFVTGGAANPIPFKYYPTLFQTVIAIYGGKLDEEPVLPWLCAAPPPKDRLTG